MQKTTVKSVRPGLRRKRKEVKPDGGSSEEEDKAPPHHRPPRPRRGYVSDNDYAPHRHRLLLLALPRHLPPPRKAPSDVVDFLRAGATVSLATAGRAASPEADSREGGTGAKGDAS